MKCYNNRSWYEVKDSTFHGLVPKGAYAVAYGTRTYRTGSFIRDEIREPCWMVLMSVYSHETHDCDDIFKWEVVNHFHTMEEAIKFKNQLTSIKEHFTIR
ncbi:hypothetical protein phiAS5_ORF0228 [Aeromonas phage phiAS5]|uniref:Uncharacterized protein n=1 Tax=Aeromonas phage phiAS5 TaxID=879630 RepID=E1A1Y2_9CAUD|nr:hypothetical protein phiAS5_ORF0228 [Aeromonas phage phiAS5]ADM80071.1 hypothetical protein phiAS5_ORF0228 [Aeromonas phage phiAS5]BES53163.1 hypothetical protein [Aeromonas phage phiWae14]